MINYASKNIFKISVPLLGLMFLLVGFAPASVPPRASELTIGGIFDGTGTAFSGVAAYLGRFEGVIDNTTEPPHAVWTAANGDTLTNITTSFEIDFSEPVGPTRYRYTQTIEFTGGTGRFQGANGSAVITGTIDVVTFEYDGWINGTISRLNSN